MQIRKNEQGFTYIEIIISILIMTVGILGMLSAIAVGVSRAQEAEERNAARQFTNAAIQSIFATRDLKQVNPALSDLTNWAAVANNTTGTPLGAFETGYNPIRKDSGIDQIEGTADDACEAETYCTVGAYTNVSEEIPGFDREIIITNIVPASGPVVRKNIVVNIRYAVGQTIRVETVSTVIADLNIQ